MTAADRNIDPQLTRMRQERDIFRKQYLKTLANYENKIKELSLLKELGNSLRSTRFYDRNNLLADQLRIVKKYAALKRVILFLLDESTRVLEIVASSSESSTPSSPASRFQPDNGPLWQSFTTKTHVVLAPDRDNEGQQLLLPVIHNEQAIGVLLLCHRKENTFDQNQIRFLNLVTDHLVTTIVISRLYWQILREESHRALLSRFFSKTVTEKIFSSKENLRLGGERKNVTILFADLRGFTSMSENLDQEKVVEILNAYFSRITPVIFEHNGTLDKFMGDGVMALFGAPISHEDDAIQAVQAAIDIIGEIKKFNDTNRDKGWPALSASIGINSGEVVAGYIGSEEHLNYTVIGDAVNVAQRIESIAGHDTIYISAAVYEAVQGHLHEFRGLRGFTMLPAQKLKGKEKSIALFRLDLASPEPGEPLSHRS